MKHLVTMMSLLLSVSASANQQLVGNWCQYFDESTEVLTIQENMDIKLLTVGNMSYEVDGRAEGYLSLGASSMSIVLGGQTREMEYKLKKPFFIGTKTLIISYTNGEKDQFVSCH